MDLWRIEMLGGLRVLHGETELSRFPTRKAASLLAYMALNGREAHPREVLAEMFWPDADADAQRNNLRLTLTRLRSVFEPDAVLETDRFAARLRWEMFTTDIADFEAAVARRDATTARRLYRGPLLPGFYDDWLTAPSARLAALWEEVKTWGNDAPPVALLLPLALPRFFGREAECKSLREHIAQERLVTLTGTGGAGKTRLTQEAIPSGAAFVLLADRTAPEQVPDAIRRALSLPPPAPGFSLPEQMREAFAQTAPPLLVLDNAEHLLDGDSLARTIIELLQAVPALRILVTSRRTLDIPGEAEFPVLPLSTKDSVALFAERARLARPGFTVTDENRASIIALCRHLDGLPLAIELAAARAGVLSVGETLEQVSERLDFLAARPRVGVPQRHESLRAAFQSTYRLLPPDLRTQFSRLSVFRGGFSAESAVRVSGCDLLQLDDLLRWSLLLREEQTEETLRFRMLEALREFAQETLSETEHVSLARRHAETMRDWVERNRADEASGLNPPYLVRLARQDREADNVRAALAFCCASDKAADRETGLRLVVAFWTFWYMRNLGEEMIAWITQLLQANAEPPAPMWQARARLTLGLALRERGETQRFATLVEEALRVLRSFPPDRHFAYGLHLHGLALFDQHLFAEADAAYKEAEAGFEKVSDRRNAATSRHNRAIVAFERGDFKDAQTLCAANRYFFTEYHETGWLIEVCLLQARLAAQRGEIAEAIRIGEEGIEYCRATGRVGAEAQSLRNLSGYYLAQGDRAVAQERAQAALSLFRKTGDRRGEATALLTLAEVMGPGAEAREYFAHAERLHELYQWPLLQTLLTQTRPKIFDKSSV